MGDRKLLEDAIFRNCQFLQVGHTETIKLAGHVQGIGTYCDSEKFPGKEKQPGSGILPRGLAFLWLPSNLKECLCIDIKGLLSVVRCFTAMKVGLFGHTVVGECQ